MQQGKLPPQATEFEDLVLGAIMLEREAYEVCAEILKPETFYKNANSIVYTAIQSLAKRNEPIDITTVVMELKRTAQLENVGGAFYVTGLTSRVAGSGNIEFHSRILAQKYIQREIIKMSSQSVDKGYDESTDIFELIDDMEAKLNALKSGLNLGGKTKSTRQMVDEALTDIKNAKTNQGVLGPRTGLKELDKILRGLRPTNVYVISGRVAMGKTSFVVCLAKALCLDQNIPIALFSLEMEGKQLIHRLLSDLAEIDNNKLGSGMLSDFEESKLAIAEKRITNNFHIDDTPAITIQYFESKIKKLVGLGVKYIILDYLGLMELSEKDRKGRNREQEIAFLTKNIKRIAKKYDVGIFELVQVGRSAEEREGCVPMLSDLKESGSIEENADIVMFLYRAEYYNIEFGKSGKPTRGKAEIIIAKHRGGVVDTAVVKWRGELTRFEDLDEVVPDTIESTINFNEQQQQPTVHF